MKTILDLEVDEISLCGTPANPPSKVTLFKSKKPAVPVQKATCRLCTVPVDDGDKYCRNCGAPFYKKETMDDKEKATTPPVDVEKADKEKTEKALADQVAKTAALEAELTKLRKAQQVRDKHDYIAKAMGAVPGETGKLAESMVELEGFSPELAKFFDETLKSVNALLEKSVVLKQASQPASKADATSPESELDRLADEVMKAEPGLTLAQAYRKALHSNPELYAKYRDSK